MFVCVCSYVLLEDETGQQGGGLFDRQIVEEAVENHLRQQQLISTGKIHTQSELLIFFYLIKQDLTHLFLVWHGCCKASESRFQPWQDSYIP